MPLAGARPVTVGTTSRVNVPLTPVPALFVTATGPVRAPTGTVVSIWVSLTRLKDAPAAPVKSTALVPVKPVPVIVTAAPTMPLAGARPVTEGTTSITKALLLPVPALLVTETGPVRAPAGTVVSIWVSLTRLKAAPGAPVKSTALVPMKPVPVIVTSVPDPAGGRCE